MSLEIKKIEFFNFRNYSKFSLETPKNLMIIVGDNAVGKTNIIEGIQLLTMMDSFRNPSWNEVIIKGEKESRLIIDFNQESRNLTTELVINEGKRTYYLNGKNKRINELQGLIPSVLFTPDDLYIIKSSSEARRNILDTLGSQLSKTYAAIKQDYQKILKQKNSLLKEKLGSPQTIEAWNQSLIKLGALLFIHRIKLYKRLITQTQEIYANFSDQEKMTAAYIPSFEEYINSPLSEEELLSLSKEETEELFYQALACVQEEEIIRMKSLIGPHRDDIQFFINGNNARSYGSQGQQRTIALSLKIAEVEIIRQLHECEPVLLLDDVMSELDEQRRKALLQVIKEETKTFITTTNLGYFDKQILKKAQVFHLLAKETS